MDRALIFVDRSRNGTILDWTGGGELEVLMREVGPVDMYAVGLSEWVETVQRPGLYAWVGEIEEVDEEDGYGKKMRGDISVATEAFAESLGYSGSRDGCLLIGEII